MSNIAFHLVKKSASKTDKLELDYLISPVSWKCESGVGRRPAGYRVKSGDVLYVAESGYAIYAKGSIGEVERVELSSYDEIIEYAETKSHIKDSKYWYSVLQKFRNGLRKDLNKPLHVLEYQMRDTQQIIPPVVLPMDFTRKGQQTSWFYHDGPLDLSITTQDLLLDSRIPGSLRMQVYMTYRLGSKTHLIDIDHHVPAAIGGPGNIEENLIPIGFSLNRYKSNRIPPKLFEYADEFGIRLRQPSKWSGKDYIPCRGQAAQDAKQLVSQINSGEIERAKKIYKEIRDYYHPGLPSLS